MTDLSIKEDLSPFELCPPIGQLLIGQQLANFLATYRDLFDVQHHLQADTAPLPATRDREFYYGDDHAAYWASGLRDFQNIQRQAERLGIRLGSGARYFELGCASGRVVRHAAICDGLEVWCADINHRHTEWIRALLPRSIRVFTNTILPTLPVDDRVIDVVAAFSVFTHIDDFEFSWLAEVRRILRPGGLAYLTMQTEHTWQRYKQAWIRDLLMPLRDRIVDYQVSDALFAGDLPRPKTVFWWNAGRHNYNATVFATADYIRREWGRFFEVVDLVRGGHVYQDVVLLRRAG